MAPDKGNKGQQNQGNQNDRDRGNQGQQDQGNQNDRDRGNQGRGTQGNQNDRDRGGNQGQHNQDDAGYRPDDPNNPDADDEE
jgi:transcription termination factor Rho